MEVHEQAPEVTQAQGAAAVTANRTDWTVAYRSHTCFKAMVEAAESQREGDVLLVRLENTVPPCRVCRAWWRRASRLKKLDAEITTRGTIWQSTKD